MDDVIKACDATDEELAKIKEENEMGWLIVPFTKFARRFDDHHDDILDKMMCTEVCPCFKSPPLNKDKDGK